MTQTPNSSSSWAASLWVVALVSTALALGAVAESQQRRVDRPEGYLEVEGDAGIPGGKGSYSVVPAPKQGGRSKAPVWHEGGQGDEDSPLQDQSPPPASAPTPREACRPQAESFSGRLAVLRGNSGDAGNEPLDYAVQRAMFGRTALHAPGDEIEQPVPELTWDDELKDLYRSYQTCVKAATRRAR